MAGQFQGDSRIEEADEEEEDGQLDDAAVGRRLDGSVFLNLLAILHDDSVKPLGDEKGDEDDWNDQEEEDQISGMPGDIDQESCNEEHDRIADGADGVPPTQKPVPDFLREDISDVGDA